MSDSPKIMGVRIATWNVNSIRSRIDRVEAWLERSDCDVLAIQETKANESQFPMLGLNALGYGSPPVTRAWLRGGPCELAGLQHPHDE